MEKNGEAKRLRIYLSNTDKFKHNPLYEMILFAAKRYDMAGATILRGMAGYGSSSVLQSVKFWEFTEKIPLVIEIIDDAEKIDLFTKRIVPWIENINKGCIITVEATSIVLYKKGLKKQGFFSFFKS